ncbi:MAG: hypothetical protein EBS06_05520 [Proteobacteria bacterium]|nr:hypothetical protein [Pseudomonadota bacterium]
MPSINNFFGTKQTTGKIFYQENLERGLKLIITQQYIHRGNDILVFEVGICKNLINSASGFQYYFDAYEWCSDSEDYIKELIISTNAVFQPVIPKLHSKPEEISFTSKSGFLIKRIVEDLHEVGEKKVKVWKYVWRTEMREKSLFDLITKL